jgi:hypothetical protein
MSIQLPIYSDSIFLKLSIIIILFQYGPKIVYLDNLFFMVDLFKGYCFVWDSCDCVSYDEFHQGDLIGYETTHPFPKKKHGFTFEELLDYHNNKQSTPLLIDCSKLQARWIHSFINYEHERGKI